MLFSPISCSLFWFSRDSESLESGVHQSRSSAGVGMVCKQEFEFIMNINIPRKTGIAQNP